MDEVAAGTIAPNPLALARVSYRDAILAGDRDEALRIVTEDTGGAAYTDVLAEVVADAQVEVGELWAAGKVTVAEEHLATEVSQFVLAAAFERTKAAEVRLGRAVVCGVEADRHQLGLQIAADALEADGWDVRFLGSGRPATEVIEVIAEQPPDLIGIGAAIPDYATQGVELMRGSRSRLGDHCPPVLLGGRAFRELASTLSGPGVFVVEDIRDAVELARQARAEGLA
jgi:MerR family transcriptional regulator, light-induced transcriptional regulator